MLKFTTLFFTVLISFQATCQQSVWSQKELNSDIDYLVTKLLEVHPDPFHSLRKEKFDLLIDGVRASISKTEYSTNEFAKQIMPIIANLGDAHTEVKVPLKDFNLFKEKGSVFPYPIIVQENEIKITEGKYKGYSIAAINGIKVQTILDNIRSYISTETAPFRDAVISRFIQKYIWFEVGAVKSIEIRNKAETLVISNFDSDDKIEQGEAQKYSYVKKGNYDCLTINDMSKKKEFGKLLKKFKKNGISDHLVIDLRQNGGGNSAIGDVLIKYLYTEKFHQVDSLVLQSSKTQKKFMYSNYVPFYIYPFVPFAIFNPVLRATFFGKNGQKSHINFKEKSAGRHLAGYKKVYVLTSNYTFSSAAILANALQFYKIAKVVGEETGGVKTFFGDNIIITLPNTGLKCTVSFKKFILPGNDEYDTNDTVKPDILVQNVRYLNDSDLIEIISQYYNLE